MYVLGIDPHNFCEIQRNKKPNTYIAAVEKW